MKKIIITGLLLFLFKLSVCAQQNGSRSRDTLQQQTTQPTSTTNPASKTEEIKKMSRSEIEAEKEAKEKGSNKNHTQVDPDKIAPLVSDTVRKVQPNRKIKSL